MLRSLPIRKNKKGRGFPLPLRRLFFVVDDFHFGLFNVGLFLVRLGRRGGAASLGLSTCFGKLFADLLHVFLQLVRFGFDQRSVLAFKSFFQSVDAGLYIGDHVGRELVLVLVERLLGAEGERVSLVAHFDLLFTRLVFLSM